MIASDQERAPALGSWDAPDEETARFTVIGLFLDEDGAFSTVLCGPVALDTADGTAPVDVSAQA